jgi:hypothetical protein
MPINRLRHRLGKEWPAIAKTAAQADAALKRIAELVRQPAAGEGSIDSGDLSVVVFGSLARGEWTAGSDVDWTLLIDGQADPQHTVAAQSFARALADAGFSEPGRTGVFGNLAFSHSIIHQIGGQEDTNRNTTQRMLLLLESRPVNQVTAYRRVILAVLHRYLLNDYRGRPLRVPRFLLNDVHRYWRTVCVDYGGKYRERAAENWALRILKLRMSRKLLYAAGLVTCFSCDPQWRELRDPSLGPRPSVEAMASYLEAFTRCKPLDILAEVLDRHARPETAVRLMDAYDRFLAALDDPTTRERLKGLRPEDAEADEQYNTLQDLCTQFGMALESLFFEDDPMLTRLMRTYGVF